MKKNLLLLAMLCSITVFSQRGVKTYLVQLGTGGSATWTKTLAANDSVVDLSVEAKNLNTWYASRTSWTKGDQIWLTTGTFNMTGVITIGTSSGAPMVTIRGGFAGSETDTIRAKGTNPWDFTYQTILDGGSSTAAATSGGILDGLTIQHFKGATAGPAATMGGGAGMRYCIVTANECTATGTQMGGGVKLTGGRVFNCHIFNNKTAGGGGGIGVAGTSLIDNCLIEGNTTSGTYGGGGIMISNSGGATISNCIIQNNTAGGNGGAIGTYLSSATAGITITNTQFLTNTATAYAGAIAVGINTNPITITGCTFTGNITSSGTASSTAGGGTLTIGAAGAVTVNKCTFTNNKTDIVYGAGIMVNANSSATPITISNSTFTGNISGDTSPANGSALYLGKTATVNNCVMYNNTGSSVVYGYAAAHDSINLNNVTIASNVTYDAKASGVYLGTAVAPSIFKNCIFYNQGASPIGYGTGAAANVTYCGFDQTTLPVYAGTGCINSIVAGSFKDVVKGDFHLVAGSTAIDAGTTIPACSSDIEGVARPQGAAYDMGAYEATLTTVNSIQQNVILMVPTQDGIVSKFNGKIQVLSVSGSVLRKAQVTVGEKIKLTSGMYIVHLSTTQGEFSQKVVL